MKLEHIWHSVYYIKTISYNYEMKWIRYNNETTSYNHEMKLIRFHIFMKELIALLKNEILPYQAISGNIRAISGDIGRYWGTFL